jgi:calcineurin-like phosphoesterase family protein
MLPPQPQFPFDDESWIISDTHFFHENIGRYCDRPDGWQETIIENLASLLKSRLYLMRGNHDRHSDGFYQRLGISLVPDPYRMDHPSGWTLIFSHRPVVPLEPGVLNLHGHFHKSDNPLLNMPTINLKALSYATIIVII